MPRIRCAIYDRVSTELQAKEGLSLDAQKEALTDYAVSHGYEIVDYYADEGLTARKKMQNRKDLMRLLRDVEAPNAAAAARRSFCTGSPVSRAVP